MKFEFLILLSLSVSAYCQFQCIQKESPQVEQGEQIMTGAPKPLSIEELNSKTITEAAQNGTHLFNLQDKSTKNYYKLVCIKSGTSQLVAGDIYKLKVTLQKTQCLKRDLFGANLRNNKENGLLSIKTFGKIENCQLSRETKDIDLNIVSIPWENTPFRLL